MRRSGRSTRPRSLADPGAVVFRPATVADAPALRRFEAENADWFESWVPARPRDYLDPGVIEATLADPGDSVFHLLEQAGAVLGRANLTGLGRVPGEAFVGYRLARSATGRGLGHRALAGLVAAARARGLVRLRALCRQDNPASAEILRRGGFLADGVTEVTFRGRSIPADRLVRAL